MTKIINDLKKTFWVLFTSSLVLGMVFLVSCDDGNDEPEPELYDLSGKYIFESAELTSGAQGIADAIGIPVGLIPTDITDAMAGGLLAEAPCDDPENGAVELRSDKKLFFTCIGETNELSAGVWDVNGDTTVLTLSLSVPQPLDLVISNLVIDETNDIIGGAIANFPINKTLLTGFLADLPEEQRNAILAGIEEDFVTLITVEIAFKKVADSE